MSERRDLTRRDALRLGAGSLLAAGLWPGALRADGAAADDFHFLVVNDLHYLDRRCGVWFERVVRRMKEHREAIDFCLLAGDLADEGKAEQLAPVRDLFSGLGMPVHVVIGNHDYLTQTDRRAYENLYPDSLNYRFEHRGWQFVGLDTSEGQHPQKTHVQPATLRWLDDTVPRLDRKRPTVVFTHFPMGPDVNSRPLNADDVLDRFREHNLRAVFCGHFHGFTERQVRGAAVTTNKCCAFSRGNHDGTREKGYFLCRARDGVVSRTFIEVTPG